MNGTLVGEAQFAGKQPYQMSLSLPVSLLREGANELSLSNVGDTGVSSLVFLDRYRLVHPQLSSLTNGRFEGTWAESGAVDAGGSRGDGRGGRHGAGPNASGASAVAVGTTGVRWMSGFESSGAGLRFQAEAGRRYLALSQEALLAPRVAAPEPSTLRATTNQADYILVAPRAFLAAAGPLVERRADQGLTARAVAFEEIASEFGHGQPSAEAIHAFLAYAFQSWARPSPRYVLLFGDSNYDPRRFIATSPPSPLPALWAKTSYLWTVSDPQLAAVNGDDSLPDLAIGRLPAATVEQAQALVAKLIAWEDSGQGLSGAAALVADNPDIAGDFEAGVRDIASSYLAGHSPQLLLMSELGAADAAAHPRRLELRPQLPQLRRSRRRRRLGERERLELLGRAEPPGPVAAAAARHDELPERLLRRTRLRLARRVAAQGRGPRRHRGLLAERAQSLDGPAHQYHRALMAALTSGRHERLGDAILAAQKAYAETGLMPELVGVYHLLGDPATELAPRQTRPE